MHGPDISSENNYQKKADRRRSTSSKTSNSHKFSISCESMDLDSQSNQDEVVADERTAKIRNRQKTPGAKRQPTSTSRNKSSRSKSKSPTKRSNTAQVKRRNKNLLEVPEQWKICRIWLHNPYYGPDMDFR